MIQIKDDKLERTNFLNTLFDIFDSYGNQDGQGLTITINGKYGSGKSTLFNFIHEKNETEKKFKILTYDAWENKFFDAPIVPIMHCISKIPSKGGAIKKTAGKVVKCILNSVLKTLANAHKIDLTAFAENTDFFEEYDAFKKAVVNCKKTLEEFCSNKKTILLVDELDRCLPAYQIKVLESLYHFLNIPNLIIVIAIDHEQLENAIKNEFGEYTDVHGYLSKLVQYEIDLPYDTNKKFAISLMSFHTDPDYEVKELIAEMIESQNIAARDIKKLIQQLNMICKEQRDGFNQVMRYYYFYPIQIAFLLLLRKFQNSIFKTYFGKELQYTYTPETIVLSESRFQNFLNDIAPTHFTRVIDTLKMYTIGQAALLNIIGLFENVRNINISSLANFINRPEDNTEKILNSNTPIDWDYPHNVNRIIKLTNDLR